jgi:hypothetical protein
MRNHMSHLEELSHVCENRRGLTIPLPKRLDFSAPSSLSTTMRWRHNPHASTHGERAMPITTMASREFNQDVLVRRKPHQWTNAKQRMTNP